MLDFAVRTNVAELTNSSVDIAEAFKRATEDKEVKLVHSMQNVTMDIATKKCTDCTSPGCGESHASGTKHPAAEISTKDSGELTKSQREQKRDAERREFEKAKLRALELKAHEQGGQTKAQTKREA